MRIGMICGDTNIVRFPIEQRMKPSIDLVFEIAPDMMEVEHLAQAFGLESPAFEIRDEADAAMSAQIREMRDAVGSNEVTPAAFDGLLQPIVDEAVVACRAAHISAFRAHAATAKLIKAQTEGGYWIKPLETASFSRLNEAAELLVDAFEASQRAMGAARAVRLAKQGKEWTPFDVQKEAEALFLDPTQQRARATARR